MAYQHYWVGLDAGHLETAVCLIDAEGGILFEAICETTSGPIRDILRRFGVEAAQCLTIEAGNGTQMVRELRSYGFPVQVVDVRKSSKFLAIRRQKTDVHDARGLAELGRLGRSIGSPVFVKPMEHQNIRTLINVRRTMLKNRARTDALIQSIFRLYGGNMKLLNGRGALAAEVNNQVRKMRQHGLEIGVNLQPLVEISEALREQISALDRQMRDIASNNPTCRNFQTISVWLSLYYNCWLNRVCSRTTGILRERVSKPLHWWTMGVAAFRQYVDCHTCWSCQSLSALQYPFLKRRTSPWLRN